MVTWPTPMARAASCPPRDSIGCSLRQLSVEAAAGLAAAGESVDARGPRWSFAVAV